MPEKSSKTALVEMAAEQSFNGIVITDANDSGEGPEIVYCNDAFCRMTGYSRPELIGESPRILQGPETDAKVIASLRGALSEGRFWEGSTTNYRKDGTPYIVRWSISPVFDDNNRVVNFLSIQEDITDQIKVEAERDMLVQALNQAHDPILVTDQEARIVFVNDAFQDLTGYRAGEVMGRTPGFLRSGEHPDDFYESMWRSLNRNEPFQARFMNRRKDGSLYHVQQNIAPVLDRKGKRTHFISTCWHVDDLVRREKILRDMAVHDGLTGLLNRKAGEMELSRRHREHSTSRSPLSLILCDVDHFKAINDDYGHPVGDRVLQSISRVITDLTRSSDPAVRWGGEEFLIIVPAAGEIAMELAERIRKAVEKARHDGAGRVTLSLGVAEIVPGEPVDSLLKRADAALYIAKDNGRNRAVFEGG